MTSSVPCLKTAFELDTVYTTPHIECQEKSPTITKEKIEQKESSIQGHIQNINDTKIFTFTFHFESEGLTPTEQ